MVRRAGPFWHGPHDARGLYRIRALQRLADRAAGIPITPETRFGLASMTKLFTAVAVADCVSAGRLRFDDAVVDAVVARGRPGSGSGEDLGRGGAFTASVSTGAPAPTAPALVRLTPVVARAALNEVGLAGRVGGRLGGPLPGSRRGPQANQRDLVRGGQRAAQAQRTQPDAGAASHHERIEDGRHDEADECEGFGHCSS
jgi:hypothetical protein